MNPAPDRPDVVDRALPLVAVAAVWAAFMPVGMKYATLLPLALLAALSIHRRRGWTTWRGDPLVRPMAALLAWLALSTQWSGAAATTAWSQWGLYLLLLAVPLVGHAITAADARRALAHFVVCANLAAAVFVVAAAGALPDAPVLWHTTVAAEGNQRIAASILLAAGASIAAWLAWDGPGRRRWLWLVPALACAVALSVQDRRSGMVLLPILLGVWVWTRLAGWARRAGAALALVAGMGLAWSLSETVRERFREGVAEVASYPGDDRVASSWGQRLRMWQLTVDSIAERPLTGHGLASWTMQWRQRVTPGTALALNTTPHNEYLLIAHHAGLAALALWLWLLWSGFRHALRAGGAGTPALLAWTAIACLGLANSVLRDAKFSLPLLLLAALGWAAARPAQATPEPRDETARLR